MRRSATARFIPVVCVAVLVATLMTGSAASGEAGSTPTPLPAPTLDPIIARELTHAVAAVKALPGVASARDELILSIDNQTGLPSPTPTAQPPHSFHAMFTVRMSADATPAEAALVPVTMSSVIAWTGVSLSLAVPAAVGRVATEVYYDGTFDQSIPTKTALGVAQGLDTIASTPGVVGVTADIPYTMVVAYGSLEVDVTPADDATTARVRSVIDGTAFKDTTLHGSFSNGAKP
jgi:hypothetical protein